MTLNRIALFCLGLALLFPPPKTSAATQQADSIVVSKSHHTLTLLAHGKPIHTYIVALGRATGPKEFEGDHKTPEGHYTVDQRKPSSRFHMALHLSYPDQRDKTRALAAHATPVATSKSTASCPASPF